MGKIDDDLMDSAAHRRPVKNGRLVLARKDGAIAAFAFTKQEYGNPDVAAFDWVLRDDGGTRLDPSDPSVRGGHGVTTRSRVAIGNLDIEWSYRGRTTGWVYYEYLAHEVPPVDALELCVTNLPLKDLPIDAGDPRFPWRAKP